MVDYEKQVIEFNKNFIRTDNFKRRIIETIISVIIVFSIISLIPFVPKVKLIFIGCFCTSIGAITIKGFRGKAISQFLTDEIKFLRRRRRLHLRSCDYTFKHQYNTLSKEDKSYAEYYYEIIKQRFIDFINKHSD